MIRLIINKETKINKHFKMKRQGKYTTMILLSILFAKTKNNT